MNKEIVICGKKIKKGTKFQGMVYIPKTTYQTPVTIINGSRPGKTLYVSAGIHGGEYPGVAAIALLAERLQPEELSGAVIFLHCVNYSGMINMTDALVPEDGENLNANFPGKPDGTIGQKIAAWLAEEMLPQADFVVDLHSGGVYESLTPCLFFPAAKQKVRKIAQDAAAVIDIPYCIASFSMTGHYSWAAMQGISGLLLERGGGGEYHSDEAKQYCRDIHNLMVYFGILNEKFFSRRTTQQIFEKTIYLAADETGFWYPAVQTNQRIKSGEKLGELKDVFGKNLRIYYAEHDGVVFYHASGFVVKKGFSNLVAYGLIK